MDSITTTVCVVAGIAQRDAWLGCGLSIWRRRRRWGVGLRLLPEKREEQEQYCEESRYLLHDRVLSNTVEDIILR